jgi:metal-responsive CopG/Arc/MetJ family transcriptional regulator
MGQTRLHVVIPEDLAREIDRMVGKRGRSKFLTQAAEKELKRLRMLQALQRAAGSWKDAAHPELRRGAARWVTKLRKLDERRRGQESLR